MMKEFRFIAMCALLLAVAGVGAQELTPKSAYALGEACFEQKKYADAIGYYKQMDKDIDIFAMDKIARCYYYLDDYNNAAHWYKLVGDNINSENEAYVSPGYLETMAEKGNPKSMAVLAWFLVENYLCYSHFSHPGEWREEEAKWQAAYLLQQLVAMGWKDTLSDNQEGYVNVDLLKKRLDSCGYQVASEPYSPTLVKKSKKKDVVAMRELGECMLFGYGCKPTVFREILKQLERPVKKEDAESMYFYGFTLQYQSNLDGNKQMAFICYLDAARRGHLLSQYMTGMCLLEGIGYGKNVKDAIDWLTLAANGGNLDAMQQLYWCYGVFAEPYGLTPDEGKKKFWMEKMAEAGVSLYQSLLGEYYYNGKEGYAVDYGKAVQWLTRAATGNEPSGDAMKLLAQCYMNGRGVARDVQKGKEWLNRAALYRNKDAQKTVQLLKGM